MVPQLLPLGLLGEYAASRHSRRRQQRRERRPTSSGVRALHERRTPHRVPDGPSGGGEVPVEEVRGGAQRQLSGSYGVQRDHELGGIPRDWHLPQHRHVLVGHAARAGSAAVARDVEDGVADFLEAGGGEIHGVALDAGSEHASFGVGGAELQVSRHEAGSVVHVPKGSERADLTPDSAGSRWRQNISHGLWVGVVEGAVDVQRSTSNTSCR